MQEIRRHFIEFEKEFDPFGALGLILAHWPILKQFWAKVITFAKVSMAELSITHSRLLPGLSERSIKGCLTLYGKWLMINYL
jgi:hypothetical protein